MQRPYGRDCITRLVSFVEVLILIRMTNGPPFSRNDQNNMLKYNISKKIIKKNYGNIKFRGDYCGSLD